MEEAVELELPLNPIEEAAARCDIWRLKEEIAALDDQKDIFTIANYVRTNAIVELMFIETEAFRVSKDDRMIRTLSFLSSQGLDFSSEVATNEDGRTSLMCAASLSAKVCRRLVELGAKLDAVDHRGRTALSYAVDGKEPLETVRVLLDAGIIKSGVPIQLAIFESNRQPFLNMVLEKCVDFEDESRSGEALRSVIEEFYWSETIFSFAEQVMRSAIGYEPATQIRLNEYLGCVCVIRSRFDFDAPQTKCWEFWRRAVQLRNGMSEEIPQKGIPRQTPEEFEVLVAINDEFTIRRLYYSIADGYRPDDRSFLLREGVHELFRLVNFSPWFSVAEDGDLTQVARFLIRNSGHCGPFFIRSVLGLIEIICGIDKSTAAERLMTDLVALRVTDPVGRTPLHYVFLYGNIATSYEMMENVLRSNPGVLRVRDVNGRSPFRMYLANVCPDPKLVKILLENGSHFDERLDGKRRRRRGRRRERIHEFLRRCKLPGFHEMDHVSLRCLAARVVADRGIEYGEGEVPAEVKELIEIHK